MSKSLKNFITIDVSRCKNLNDIHSDDMRFFVGNTSEAQSSPAPVSLPNPALECQSRLLRITDDRRSQEH